MTKAKDKEKFYAKKKPVFEGQTSDKSEYLALKWDYEHNTLPGWKVEKYLELKEVFENDQ